MEEQFRETSATQSSWYVELAHRTPEGRFRRNRFIAEESLPASRTLREQHPGCELFSSLCRYPEPKVDDVVSAPDFLLDIDSRELEHARRHVLEAADLLIDRLGLATHTVGLFFSGAKGFHLKLSRHVFNITDGRGLLPVWAHLARRLQREGVEGIDHRLYEPRRIFRTPNTPHPGLGLYKVPVEYAELRDLGLEHVLECAQAPRESDDMAESEHSVKAEAWLRDAKAWVQRAHNRRARHAAAAPSSSKVPPLNGHGWRTPPCIRRLENAPLPRGLRHEALYTIARFFATTGMAQDEVEARLHAINRHHPIEDADQYVPRTTRNGFARPGMYGCPNPTLGDFCSPESCPLSARRDCVNHNFNTGES